MKRITLNYRLEDSKGKYGGIAMENETLKQFLDSVGLSYKTSMKEINKALKLNGIKKIKGKLDLTDSCVIIANDCDLLALTKNGEVVSYTESDKITAQWLEASKENNWFPVIL